MEADADSRREVAGLIEQAKVAGLDVASQEEWYERTGPDDTLTMLPELRSELRAMLGVSEA
jgi:hypothetical protein